MWFLVIPFVVLTSFWRVGPVAAEAPDAFGRVTWPGIGLRESANREGMDVRRERRGATRPGDADIGKARPAPEEPGGSQGDGPRLDVNACSYGDLLRLPGIGPKKARAILEERERRPFRSVHDLTRVKGIGAKTVRKLAPHVVVGTTQ